MRFLERIIQITLSQNAAQIATLGYAFHSSQRVRVMVVFLLRGDYPAGEIQVSDGSRPPYVMICTVGMAPTC